MKMQIAAKFLISAWTKGTRLRLLGLGLLAISLAALLPVTASFAQTGTITTVAGNGGLGYNGDGIPATSASLYIPHGVAVDGAGNLFIADVSNNRIRKVDGRTAIITTVAKAI